jgi:hypothetical protein
MASALNLELACQQPELFFFFVFPCEAYPSFSFEPFPLARTRRHVKLIRGRQAATRPGRPEQNRAFGNGFAVRPLSSVVLQLVDSYLKHSWKRKKPLC